MDRAGIDALVSPTVPHLPLLLSEVDGAAESAVRSVGGAVGRNTLPGNVWGLCGASLPVHHFAGGALPVGLQLLGRDMAEEKVLAIAMALEALCPP